MSKWRTRWKGYIMVVATCFALCMLGTATGCSRSETETEHHHVFGAYKVTKEATCSSTGTEVRTCQSCGYTEQRSIPSNGIHQFGAWTMQGDSTQIRSCQRCGYTESSIIGGISDSSQPDNPGTPSQPGNPASGKYMSFHYFLDDCRVSDYRAEYTGDSNAIEVSLEGNIGACNGYTVVIPSRVTDVTFVGNTQGDEALNFHIVVDKRNTDVNLTFHNVRVRSEQGTIVTSETSNIRVNITMTGETCSFIGGNGRRGDNGEDGFGNGGDAWQKVRGKDGENGKAAFLINGICTIQSKVKRLVITGGNGGDGGNAGNFDMGNPADGGRGGNGANAIQGETHAEVRVASGCIAEINPGLGGNGGNGGKTGLNGFGPYQGSSGSRGDDGESGCNISYSND